MNILSVHDSIDISFRGMTSTINGRVLTEVQDRALREAIQYFITDLENHSYPLDDADKDMQDQWHDALIEIEKNILG